MKEIEALWEEIRQLSLGSSTTRVERLDSPPSPLQFIRDFVSQNKPCIISNANLHWPALSLWSDPSYLSRVLSDSVVSVHFTPDGRADALAPIHPSSRSLCFASAHVEQMPFPRALGLVLSSSSSANNCDRHNNNNEKYRDSKKNDSRVPVAYLQQQNDCFRTEYSELASDCDSHIQWATEALGCPPEAVNLWIGNNRSETSFHKDHYENLYAVVSGEKHFLLLPPTDVHRLYIRSYPAAHYSYSQGTGQFKLELEKPLRYVPWCSVNPYPSPGTEDLERSRFPLYFNGPKPFECTIKAGEMLYLPSMWFHNVRQGPNDSGCTIAVNYWYDMQFDIKYAYFNFLQSLPYGSSPNPTFSEIVYEDLVPDASGCSLEDKESDAASTMNGGK